MHYNKYQEEYRIDMEDCIFCKIANKEIPSSFVYEDEHTVAFNDLNPQAPTHILVIPKEHYASLNELDNEQMMSALFMAVKNVTKQLNIKEYRTVINTGESAGQTVFHLHIHILAGRPLKWPPG